VVIANALDSGQAARVLDLTWESLKASVPALTVATSRTSTTNWSDRFINADKFPEVVSRSDINKYVLPPIPELDERPRALVG
jgi:hypothetical protein